LTDQYTEFSQEGVMYQKLFSFKAQMNTYVYMY